MRDSMSEAEMAEMLGLTVLELSTMYQVGHGIQVCEGVWIKRDDGGWEFDDQEEPDA